MPPRTPQTSDPGGAPPQLTQLLAILGKMNESNQTIGQGLDKLSANLSGSVRVQKVILQVMLTMAEMQGVSFETLVKQVRVGGDDAAEKFVAALGTTQGKS
jgi:hypothetical protein